MGHWGSPIPDWSSPIYRKSPIIITIQPFGGFLQKHQNRHSVTCSISC